MKKLASLALAAVAALATGTAAQAAWTKSYVVSWLEPAMYYGGGDDPLAPGSDCPTGTNKEIDWVQVFIDAGYTPEQAAWLRNPANPTRDPVHGQNQMAFRGENRENVYIKPWTTPEVGFPTVQGKIAEGLNLDGKSSTGFTSPTGQKGIDNNYYKVFGCWKSMRGKPKMATSAVGLNDTMRSGSFAVLMVVSGQGSDPMNDKNVTVGIYDSKDTVVTGGGDVNADYTFRVKPNKLIEGLMKARTVKGKIITDVTPQIDLPPAGAGGFGPMHMLKARAELQIKPNGELEGMLGGYIPWQPIYDGYVGQRGPIFEVLGWIRLPDVYYALKREADYSPTGPKGEKTHMSYNMRIFAKPAFVMTPDGQQELLKTTSFKAVAPPPGPQRTGLVFNSGPVIDGLLIRPGSKPVSQTEEQLKPPNARVSAK